MAAPKLYLIDGLFGSEDADKINRNFQELEKQLATPTVVNVTNIATDIDVGLLGNYFYLPGRAGGQIGLAANASSRVLTLRSALAPIAGTRIFSIESSTGAGNWLYTEVDGQTYLNSSTTSGVLNIGWNTGGTVLRLGTPASSIVLAVAPTAASMNFVWSGGSSVAAFSGPAAMQYFFNGRFIAVVTGATTNAAIVARGQASQVGPLAEFQNSSSVLLSSVTAAGYFSTQRVLLNGTTSGTLTLQVPATVTSYALIMPAATGTGALTNDGAGNLSWAAGGGSYTDENVDDRVNNLLVAGTNITLTYNDVANTLTIDATVGSHTHVATDVTSGVFAVARIPDLSAIYSVVAHTHTHASLTGIGANDHHNQIHGLVSGDHTVSGLTIGHVVTALSATTFGFAAPAGGTSFATGAILFGDGTTTPAVDASDFFWAIGTNRLGLGTNAPAYALHVLNTSLPFVGIFDGTILNYGAAIKGYSQASVGAFLGLGLVNNGVYTETMTILNTGNTRFKGDLATYGTAQMIMTGATDSNKQLLFGYHTTDNKGFIQSVHQGITYTDLVLQPLGGNVVVKGFPVPGIMFTQTADKTISNTTTVTTLFGVGQGSLATSSIFWTPGRTVCLKLRGLYNTKSGTVGSFVIRLRLGSTTLVTTGVISTLPPSIADRAWEFEAVVTTRTNPDVNGKFMVLSSWRHLETASGQGVITEWSMVPTVVAHVPQEITVATNVSNTFDVDAQWGTADANNVITCNTAVVEALN